MNSVSNTNPQPEITSHGTSALPEETRLLFPYFESALQVLFASDTQLPLKTRRIASVTPFVVFKAGDFNHDAVESHISFTDGYQIYVQERALLNLLFCELDAESDVDFTEAVVKNILLSTEFTFDKTSVQYGSPISIQALFQHVTRAGNAHVLRRLGEAPQRPKKELKLAKERRAALDWILGTDDFHASFFLDFLTPQTAEALSAAEPGLLTKFQSFVDHKNPSWMNKRNDALSYAEWVEKSLLSQALGFAYGSALSNELSAPPSAVKDDFQLLAESVKSLSGLYPPPPSLQSESRIDPQHVLTLWSDVVFSSTELSAYPFGGLSLFAHNQAYLKKNAENPMQFAHSLQNVSFDAKTRLVQDFGKTHAFKQASTAQKMEMIDCLSGSHAFWSFKKAVFEHVSQTDFYDAKPTLEDLAKETESPSFENRHPAIAQLLAFSKAQHDLLASQYNALIEAQKLKQIEARKERLKLFEVLTHAWLHFAIEQGEPKALENALEWYTEKSKRLLEKTSAFYG